MSKIAPALLFVSLVSSIYFGMNWYVLGRLLTLFGVARRPWWFHAALVPLSLSFVLALTLESRFGTRVTGGFFTLAMGWLGLCGLFVWLLLVQQALALVLPLPPRAWAIGVCAVAGGLALYASVNAHTITVRREQVPGLPLRVVHLSDIHIGSIGPALLADIIAKTNGLHTDLVLMPGDLFDDANATTRAVSQALRQLAAPTIFTSGNHEAYAGYDQVREMLATTSIRWLRNEILETQGVTILGLDNSYGTELMEPRLPDLSRSTAFTILMNHQPRGADLAARYGVGLMLSGHVHNGQIWPFNYIVGLFYPYLKGLHLVDRTYLNVSTGTGVWGPPMRLGSHSEIVLLEPPSR